LRHLHCRQSAERLGDRAALDRHPAAGVPLCGCDRDRGGNVGDVFSAAVPDQCPATMVRSAQREAAFSVMPISHGETAAADGPRAAVGRPRRAAPADVRSDPTWVRLTVITISVGFLGIFVVLPLIVVFAEAFSKGVETYIAALADPDTLAAIWLTLVAAA